MARSGRPWRLLVPLIAVLAGLLFATSAATAKGTDLRGGRRAALTDLIAAQQHRVADYEAQARALRLRVQRTTAADAGRDASAAGLRAQAEALAGPAGLGAVTGPAVTVTLRDAPRPRGGQMLPGNPSPDDLVVHQQDVQGVVNALWAGGAEAMTIMGERVISTSAVRCVGNTLLLHGAVYSPPFTVTAVGDVDRMRAALDRDPLVTVYRQYVDAYGLGYQVSTANSRRLPGYDGPVELGHARAG